MDWTQRICWQNIIHLSPLPRAEPRPSAQGPEWNINVPNSICRSQSYFLDEQCRHFCVMDDEHAGTVCCWPNNEAGAESKSLVKLWLVVLLCCIPSIATGLKKKKEPPPLNLTFIFFLLCFEYNIHQVCNEISFLMDIAKPFTLSQTQKRSPSPASLAFV